MAIDPSRATPPSDREDARSSALVDALSVYVEPLVASARIAVVGDVELGLYEQLLALGARTVHLYDPDPERVARTSDVVPRGVSVRMLRDEFDVRDGAFDLVVIPDIGVLPDPGGAIVRLRRVTAPQGNVVAMGRARTSNPDAGAFPELAPAVVEYAELYDLFALQFESVTMTGVVPFAGVVFAELGAGDDLAVSVDTRLVDQEAPTVFVVVAGREAALLDPYAIVQLARETESMATVAIDLPVLPRETEPRDREVAAEFAAMQLKADLLASQLDEHRTRLAAADSRRAEQSARLERMSAERDLALTRAMNLEGGLQEAQRALAAAEQRVAAAEREMLDRDDRLAALHAELDSVRSQDAALTTTSLDPALVEEAALRAERAEASLALHVADLAQLSEAHAIETSNLEEQLRDRAHVIAAMERELGRREHLVRELVVALEEARDVAAAGGAGPVFEAAPVLPGVPVEEVARLRRKLDELAMEVARREGELVAQAWRIAELESEKARLVSAATSASPPGPADAGSAADLAHDLARARDELDALRQALTQEHAARVAAESGEELSRARTELARQAALLEQIRTRST